MEDKPRTIANVQGGQVGELSEFFYPTRHKGWQTANRLCLSSNPPRWITPTGLLFDNPGEDASILHCTRLSYRYETDEQAEADYKRGRFRAFFNPAG